MEIDWGDSGREGRNGKGGGIEGVEKWGQGGGNRTGGGMDVSETGFEIVSITLERATKRIQLVSVGRVVEFVINRWHRGRRVDGMGVRMGGRVRVGHETTDGGGTGVTTSADGAIVDAAAELSVRCGNLVTQLGVALG